MVKYKIFIGFIVWEIVVLLFFYIDSLWIVGRKDGEIKEKQLMVKVLSLTDFAIWTEARYTRHPSQSDNFSPFQDYPSSFDYFPAGSIMEPSYIK